MSELKVNKIKGSNVPENGPDLTIESTGNFNFDSGTLYVDTQNNRVGVNNTSPTQDLDVNGGLKVNSKLKIPTWTTGTRPSNPEIGSMGFNSSPSINTVEMWTGTQWVRVGQAEPGLSASYISSAGLTLISGTAGQYDSLYERVYSTPGTYTFTAPTTDFSATILVAGAGAGGGAYHAGGGGAGGVVYGRITLIANQAYTVVVGNRGRGGIRDGNGSNDGEQGGDSSFGTFIARGGGGGRWRCTSVDGGCGGGGGHHAGTHCGQGERMSVSTQSAYSGMNTFPAAGSASGGHGHNGHGAGGGGGAGRAGDLSIGAGRQGQGGAGIFLMGRGIAGGGGGGAHSGQVNFAMPGGSGGGGHGRTENTQADQATSHGSGGGGGGHTSGGHGGSGSVGLVVIRMQAKVDESAGELIPTNYFTGFSLISGSAGTPGATYRRDYTSLGAFSFTAPPIACTARVILVGGGGSSAGAHAGGGGGGGVVVGNYALTANQVINGTIGDGGGAATSYGGNGQNGTNSTFGIWTALGGGGSDGTNSGQSANSGGSGGGGGPSSGAPGSGHVAGGAATQPAQSNPGAFYNLGHAGGWGNMTYGSHGSGGGGGAGGIGHYSNGTASGNTHSKGNGDGGRGYYSPFLNAHWGGGGGGGGHNGNAWNAGGTGGAGGGGNGSGEGGKGGAGTPNTGGGGGGSGHGSGDGTGARGGSGVCIIIIRADGVANRIPE
jgi:hypothetical protein